MVESSELPEGTLLVPAERVIGFVGEAFAAVGVPAEDAALVADVLVSADRRGIRSHGVARMSYFLVRLESGVIDPSPRFGMERGSPTTAVMDAGGGIGIVAADRAMDAAIGMAEEHGSGFVAVGHSSHFGYAGYWADRAMARGFIGLSMSNSGRRVAPTGGRAAVLGTNPLAVAMPGGEITTDFHLDMATSAVAVGKVETALREGRPIPGGWVSEAGDPPRLDDNDILTFEAPLLPLGGEGVQTGGHKGYGLSLMVELLCGALAGSTLSDRIAGAAGDAPPAMGHFMGAIDMGGFREPRLVQSDMSATFEVLRDSPKAPGNNRILIHGEPESEAERQSESRGIPVTPAVRLQLERWAARLDLDQVLS